MEDENEGRLNRVKRHLKDNKKTYLIGAGCLAAGYFLRRPGTTAIINNVAPSIAPVMSNIVNTTVNNAGHLRKIVEREDGKLWSSVTDAALELAQEHDVTLDRARWLISRCINGHEPHVFGLQYVTIGVGTTG